VGFSVIGPGVSRASTLSFALQVERKSVDGPGQGRGQDGFRLVPPFYGRDDFMAAARETSDCRGGGRTSRAYLFVSRNWRRLHGLPTAGAGGAALWCRCRRASKVMNCEPRYFGNLPSFAMVEPVSWSEPSIFPGAAWFARALWTLIPRLPHWTVFCTSA